MSRSLLCAVIVVAFLLFNTHHNIIPMVQAGGRNIDLFTDAWRYAGYGPIPDDLIGLKPGVASGSQVESYSPQDLVCLYAELTYNGQPIVNKEVEFEINGPLNSYRNITIWRQAFTNESGIAEICFEIPWSGDCSGNIAFGQWKAIAKASVANVEISDWHWWLVHWMVQVCSEIVTPNPVARASVLTVSVNVTN